MTDMISMHCASNRHSQCGGFTQDQGKNVPCACDCHKHPGLGDRPRRAEKLPAKQERSLDLAHFPGARDAGSAAEISAAAAVALITWSEKYGLDAWRGDTCYMYGKPYVTEKGAIANARKDKRYKGFAVYKIPDADVPGLDFPEGSIVRECAVIMDGYEGAIAEYGVVIPQEIEEVKALPPEKAKFLPLYRFPGHVARARAIRRAHLLAVPLGDYEPREERRPETE